MDKLTETQTKYIYDVFISSNDVLFASWDTLDSELKNFRTLANNVTQLFDADIIKVADTILSESSSIRGRCDLGRNVAILIHYTKEMVQSKNLYDFIEARGFYENYYDNDVIVDFLSLYEVEER